MRGEIADLVHNVIQAGLRLRQRLDDEGERPSLAAEQATLTAKLLESEGQRWPDYTGDPGYDAAGGGDRFLGGKYALTCWLDEIFTLDVKDEDWRKEWNERTLEQALFRSRVRASAFWAQAKRAEGRPGADALEIFYLCVMLGFRGNLRGRPEQLTIWRAVVERRVGEGQGTEWPAPEGRELVTDAPPLRGWERLRRVGLTALVLLGVLIPVVTFFLARD
jgi:type VI secretion system protein ImpK